ncbi:MAG: DUF4058 family protein [Planctomycetes bacterium]|nr:DUF4058 family protein [Planctomycetota bacterium]
MPVHDWTRVDAGLFHDFHQGWTVGLRDALNRGILPLDHYALIEQKVPRKEPDVLTLKLDLEEDGAIDDRGGIAVATAPPKTRLVRQSEVSYYAGKANRITVRHRHGEVVAVVELVSPGNKSSRAEFKAFVEKSAAFITSRVNLLIIDLFPPTRRDPKGIHKAIWDEFEEENFTFPRGKPLTLASYDAGPPQVAYVENVGVGDSLPEMPIFLRPEFYVNAPLEPTYRDAWSNFPRQLKGLLEKAPRRKRK